MIDTTTNMRLYVSTEGDAGPYIMVPVDQLEIVVRLLDEHSIPHWTDEEAISVDGKPEVAVINLVAGCDFDRVQRLLDAIP